MSENPHKTDGSQLVASAARAASDQYLGDVHFVDNVLRHVAGRVLTRFNQVGAGTMSREAAVETDAGECATMAEVFVGADAAYTPVEGWTGPGLASYLRRRMGNTAQEADDRAQIEQAFAAFIHAIYDVVRADQDQDTMAAAMAEECRSFAWLLVGIEGHD